MNEASGLGDGAHIILCELCVQIHYGSGLRFSFAGSVHLQLFSLYQFRTWRHNLVRGSKTVARQLEAIFNQRQPPLLQTCVKIK